MIGFLFSRRSLRAVLLMLLFNPANALAMLCTLQGTGDTQVRGDLGSRVAIPETLADGEVVWRSERYSLMVECAREGQQAVAQDVFLHLNPDRLEIGQGIRMGVNLDGGDHFSGRIATGQQIPVCHEGDSNIGACPRVRFNLGFSLFIQKFGAVPPSGVPVDVPDYRVFELNGESSAPAGRPGSLSYVLDNLTGLRFVACDAQLQVFPEVLEFGALPIRQVVVGKVFERRPFTLQTQRSCDSPFSLDARFRPVTGQVVDNLLVPANNASLGIRLVRAADALPLGYNQLFHLADLLGDVPSQTTEFNAELVWQSTRPIAGPFAAEVMIDLFYK